MALPDNISNTSEKTRENSSFDTVTGEKAQPVDQVTESALQQLLSGSNVKGVNNGFIQDIYTEEEQTPHNEMQQTRQMMLQNAYMNTAVDTVSDLMLGKYQKVVSSDEATEEFFNERFLDRANVREALAESAADFIAYGNFYVERLRNRFNNKTKRYETVAHPERMWKVIDDDKVDSFILEVPRQKATKDLDRYTVSYGRYKQRSVYGVKFDTSEIFSGRMGQGDFRFYGRSPLASAMSDAKILREVERSMAVFSRFKSVPKKLVSVMDNQETPLTPKGFDSFVRDWNSLGDMENMIVNGRKFDVEDMDYAGNQVDFSHMTDYFKRKITSTLIPEYYLHGENTTHAVSNSQESTFMLRMKSWRNQFLDAWNQELKRVAKNNGLSTDVELELGPFNVETDQEKREKALKSYNAGMITVNEARKLMGLDPAEDEMIGQSYKWELQEQPAVGPLAQKLEDLAGGD